MEPQLSFGPRGCTLVEQQLGTKWSNFTWMCDFPGANSSVKKCADSFRSWLLPSFLPSEAKRNELFGNETLFNVLPRFLDDAHDSIVSLFPNMSQPLVDGLEWITKAHAAVLEAGAGAAHALCSALHQGDQYGLLFTDPGLSSTHTVGVYHSPPVPTIVGQMASRTTRMTREPPRVVVPTVSGFPPVTATSFLLYEPGAFTILPGSLNSEADVEEVTMALTKTPAPSGLLPVHTDEPDQLTTSSATRA